MNDIVRREGECLNPIHQENGRWYFWDETWSDRCGPYDTEEKCREELERYCNEAL